MVRSQGDLDDEVHQLTCAERDAGWLEGPFEVDHLEDGALVSRRFGLKQGEKTRLIDDLTVGGVNGTVQVAESPLPHTTDLLASLALAINSKGNARFEGRGQNIRLEKRVSTASGQQAVPMGVVCCSLEPSNPEAGDQPHAGTPIRRSTFSLCFP